MIIQLLKQKRTLCCLVVFLALSSLASVGQNSPLHRLDAVLLELADYDFGEPETWKPELMDVMRTIYADPKAHTGATKKLSDFINSDASEEAKKEARNLYYNLTGKTYTKKPASKSKAEPQSPEMVKVANLNDQFRNSKDPVAFIRKSLADASDEFRPHIIRLVRALPQSFQNGSSLLSIQNLNSHDKAQLLNLLAKRRDPSIHETAVSYLKGNETALKVAALQAFHLLGKVEDIEYLTSLAARDDEFQDLARDALSRIPGEAIDQKILRLLPKATAFEKAELIQTIEKRNTTSAWPMLVKLSGTESTDLRIQSIRALALIAPVTGLKDVIDLLMKAENKKVSSEIEKAIYRIAVRSADNDSATKVIQAYQRSTKDESVKNSLSNILKKLQAG